jgi:hypothetical protein
MSDQKNIPRVSFGQFIEKFPEIKLPVILAEDSHHSFSKHNEPLPGLMVEQFIQPLETEPTDEFTEFVPCLRLPETYDFHAIVYWRAGLMNYQYTLATFTKKGELIDKRVIAGTFSDGKVLITSVATLDEDWIIYIASGQSKEGLFDASNSTTSQLELLPEGNIIHLDR